MTAKLQDWWFNNKGDIAAFFTFIAVIGGIAFLFWQMWGAGTERVQEIQAADAACLRAGYTEIQDSTDGFYCIGIRDGNTVTVLVSELEKK